MTDCVLPRIIAPSLLGAVRGIISTIITYANNLPINPLADLEAQSLGSKKRKQKEYALTTFARICFLLPTHSTPFSPADSTLFVSHLPSLPFSLRPPSLFSFSLALVTSISINFTSINTPLKNLFPSEESTFHVDTRTHN